MQQTNRIDKAHRALTVTINKSLNSELYTMHARASSNKTHEYMTAEKIVKLSFRVYFNIKLHKINSYHN